MLLIFRQAVGSSKLQMAMTVHHQKMRAGRTEKAWPQQDLLAPVLTERRAILLMRLHHPAFAFSDSYPISTHWPLLALSSTPSQTFWVCKAQRKSG